MEKKWREENERIMREHPLQDAIEHPEEPVMTALPPPDEEAARPASAERETAPDPIKPAP
jgi:sec-independent protein translocase protein TatB